MRTTEKKKELANYIDQFDVVDIISKRTNYYKYQVREVIEVLEDIIYKQMQEATVDKPSECRLFFGLVIGAKRIPGRIKKMPPFGKEVYVPEHLNPYARFKGTFRKKVNSFKTEEKKNVDETTE